MDKKINYLFNPKTIAVIGASNEKGSVGYNLFANLINSKYQGKVYPVNIKRKKIQNVIAYLTIKDVPTKIDLAVIAVPAKFVPAVVEECGQAGVKTAVIISAGFKEIGPAGEKLQQTLVENAHKYGIQILGPNCLGFIRTDANLNVSFAGKRILPGKTAFLSQSGALGTALLDWLGQNNIGYSYFISLGGMADLDFTDLIEYLCSDKNTDNILIYMESLPRGRKFLEIAAKITASKPIMIIKTGRSVAGARAAKSHTGSLTGDDQVFSAAFEQAGIIRIDTIEDFFNVSKSIAMQPQPTGNRLAIVTNAGGVGVIATDALMFYKGELANLNKASMAELNKILPTSWSHGNPVDILGDADSKRYSQAIKICLADNAVNALLVILTPQAMTEPTEAAKEVIKACHNSKKMVLACWLGGKDVAAGIKILEENNIPNFTSPESAVRCFLLRQKRNHQINFIIPNETSAIKPEVFEKSKEIFAQAKREQRSYLNELQAKQLLANYGLPIVKNVFVKTAAEAAEKASQLGFPVVMKILSAEIIHKIDWGGVILNINSREQAIAAFNKITDNINRQATQKKIQGIFIEPQISKRYELLLGYKRDDVFGPIIAFGTGGTTVEIYRDINLALAPLNQEQIQALISKTKIYKLLKGYRNLPAVDLDKLKNLIYQFSKLVLDFQDEIKEIDINPLVASENSFIILDAKVVLK